jgi:glycogen synthase
VIVVAPWYPSAQQPFGGAFVQAMVEAVAPVCDALTVYHCDAWPAPKRPVQDLAVRRAYYRLLRGARLDGRTVAGARLVYAPVPTVRGQAFADIARRHERTLTAVLAGRRLAAPVVHAHVGLPSGWAAMRNLDPATRLFVTEHATFLDSILAEPAARVMYDQVLARCTTAFAVGGSVRALLSEVFPQHVDKIAIIPNPVAFDRPRATPVTELRRWLFLGSLIKRKGVDLLLEAFARCRAVDAGLQLTIVGEGPLAARLDERAGELGVRDSVSLLGTVSHRAALKLMREHDLLVHASRLETFGMTIVEAIAAGMPVLATRSGGPQETLAGIERDAGELIEVRDDADALVAGYWRLRDRFPHDLDLARAQRELAARYGYPAVADAHLHAWFPD